MLEVVLRIGAGVRSGLLSLHRLIRGSEVYKGGIGAVG